MIRFFTFCDKNYVAQAAVMWKSLLMLSSDKIDGITYTLDYPASEKMELWIGGKRLSENIRVDPIWLVECQEERLAEAQKNRSYRSYCWSLEPAIVHRQLLDAEDGSILCYVDSDSMFFADPIPTIRSVMERADVALSRHHFPAGQEHRERTVGVYNFGCGVFRACDLTRRIVGEWLDQTLEKCDEFGAGDQKYLDQWPDKFGDRLAELPPGMNLGPWSLAEAVCDIDGNLLHMKNGERHTTIFPLISYHAHETRRGIGRNPVIIKEEQWNLTNYEIADSTRKFVYEPYVQALSAFL